jgi:hypothetical protein
MAEFSTRRVSVLLAVAAIGLAACSGSRPPHVASLGRDSGTGSPSASQSSTTTTPNGNPTQLLDEWASCMQRHGDPGQPDPTIDANKVIHITWNGAATPGGIYGTDKGGQGNSGPGQYCRSYLNAAQVALRGGPPKQLDPTKLVKFSECMRANGIPDFPDPIGRSLSIPMNGGGDLNPANPTFHAASKLCAHKTRVPAFGGGPQPGMIVLGDGQGGGG